MATTAIKYDVSDVPSGGGGLDPEAPKTYNATIADMTHRKAYANGKPHQFEEGDLEVVVDVGSEYRRLWTYIPLSPNAGNLWKLREFADAIGAPPKGGLKELLKGKGKKVICKTRLGTDNDGNPRAEVKNLFKAGSVDVDESGEGDGEAAATGDEIDFSEWTDDDVKAELESREIKVSGRWTREKGIEALTEAMEADAQGDGASGDAPEEPEEFDYTTIDGYEDLDNWDADDLKAEIAEKEIEISGRFSAQKAKDAIIAYLAEQQGSGDGASGGEPDDEYDTWNEQELKDEVASRVEQGASVKVPGRFTREKAIAALRADDSEAEPF